MGLVGFVEEPKMKIDSNLRAAIRAAFNAQPNYGWQMEAEQNRQAIAALFKAKPYLGKRARALMAKEIKAQKELNAASQALCVEFGLRVSEGLFEFSRCGGGHDQFKKLGGKLPTKNVKWRYRTAMAELVMADPSDEQTILKKYGINWK